MVLNIKDKVCGIETNYEINYDIEDDNWSFPLLTDLKKGDLLILDQ